MRVLRGSAEAMIDLVRRCIPCDGADESPPGILSVPRLAKPCASLFAPPLAYGSPQMPTRRDFDRRVPTRTVRL